MTWCHATFTPKLSANCNRVNKAAVRLTQLERPVKEMIGGIIGWIDEGFKLAKGMEPSSIAEVETEDNTA